MSPKEYLEILKVNYHQKMVSNIFQIVCLWQLPSLLYVNFSLSFWFCLLYISVVYIDKFTYKIGLIDLWVFELQGFVDFLAIFFYFLLTLMQNIFLINSWYFFTIFGIDKDSS